MILITIRYRYILYIHGYNRPMQHWVIIFCFGQRWAGELEFTKLIFYGIFNHSSSVFSIFVEGGYINIQKFKNYVCKIILFSLKI